MRERGGKGEGLEESWEGGTRKRGQGRGEGGGKECTHCSAVLLYVSTQSTAVCDYVSHCMLRVYIRVCVPGRFLGAILEVVSKWHAAEALYEQVSYCTC